MLMTTLVATGFKRFGTMARKITYKFGGKCNGCDRAIRHARTITVTQETSDEWVRCKECNQVTQLQKTGEV